MRSRLQHCTGALQGLIAAGLLAGCVMAAEPDGPRQDPPAPASPHPKDRADARAPGPPGAASAEARGASAAPAAPREPTEAERALYTYLPPSARVRALVDAAPAPSGFSRAETAPGSFASFLRGLPLRDQAAEVHAYDGSVLRGADDHRVFAVAELDVSPIDVQQCADSVIRLHAEWLWSRSEKSKIGYHFLSGDFATYDRYAAGERPQVDGNRVRWSTSASPGDDRKTFRRYLDMVFNYASTISLAHRTAKIGWAELQAGDFIVLPGGPGHAILILDVASDADGRRVALLGQGFMPAQDFHVLESGEAGVSPWFSLEGEAVDTPFWPAPFPRSSLRRFD